MKNRITRNERNEQPNDWTNVKEKKWEERRV